MKATELYQSTEEAKTWCDGQWHWEVRLEKITSYPCTCRWEAFKENHPRRKAAELRGLAAKGMNPRAYLKESQRLEAEAAGPKKEGRP